MYSTEENRRPENNPDHRKERNIVVQSNWRIDEMDPPLSGWNHKLQGFSFGFIEQHKSNRTLLTQLWSSKHISEFYRWYLSVPFPWHHTFLKRSKFNAPNYISKYRPSLKTSRDRIFFSGSSGNISVWESSQAYFISQTYWTLYLLYAIGHPVCCAADSREEVIGRSLWWLGLWAFPLSWETIHARSI